MFDLQRGAGSASIHRQLVEGLSAEFARYSPGERLPSAPALQRRFGVAYRTIVRALDELVVRDEVTRIRGKGTFVSSRELQEIYFLTPCPAEIANFSVDILDGAMAEAQQMGIRLKTLHTSQTNQSADIDWNSLKRLPEGAAVIVNDIEYYRHVFDILNARHCRVVLYSPGAVMEEIMEEKIKNFHLIRLPFEQAIEDAVRMLRERGRHRIVLLHRDRHIDYPAPRFFRAAMARCGLPFAEELELFTTENYPECIEFFELFCMRNYPFDAVVTAWPVQGWRFFTCSRNCTGKFRRMFPFFPCGTTGCLEPIPEPSAPWPSPGATSGLRPCGF